MHACPACGSNVRQQNAGRPRVYCGGSCRNRAYNARRAAHIASLLRQLSAEAA